jgi:hypothetical protein
MLLKCHFSPGLGPRPLRSRWAGHQMGYGWVVRSWLVVVRLT